MEAVGRTSVARRTAHSGAFARYGSDEEVGGHGRLGEPECTKSAPNSVGQLW